MKVGNTLLAALCAAAVTLSLAPITDAQPRSPKERREDRKERRKERRDDLKEKRKEKKEKRKELKEKHKEKKARHQELKEKEKAGTLSDEEKAELEKMEANHKKIKARHDKLKERHQKLKTTYKTRRRAARRAAIKKWGRKHLKKKPVRGEMAKHALRMAKLNRLREIAQAEGNDEAVAKIDALIKAEKDRHAAKMAALTK